MTTTTKTLRVIYFSLIVIDAQLGDRGRMGVQQHNAALLELALVVLVVAVELYIMEERNICQRCYCAGSAKYTVGHVRNILL